MGNVFDDLEEPPYTSSLWRAKFATSPANLEAKVMITVPAINPVVRLGPCFWQSRDSASLPSVGDACLAFLDDTGDWWVLAWWPTGVGGGS
jgi:hypothetical protein